MLQYTHAKQLSKAVTKDQSMNQHNYIPPVASLVAPQESKIERIIIAIACLAVFAFWGVLLAFGV